MGVDGLRIDAAPAMSKKAGLPGRRLRRSAVSSTVDWDDNPHWDVDDVHDIFRRWRAIADSYDGDRVFVAEAVVSDPERLSRLRAAGRDAHGVQLPLPQGHRGRPRPLRAVIDETHRCVRAESARPSTWVLTSHDETRPVTRYGRAHTGSGLGQPPASSPVDLDLGPAGPVRPHCSRSRCPGRAYLYQGEELGLPEVDDLPDEVLQDPTWERSGQDPRP